MGRGPDLKPRKRRPSAPLVERYWKKVDKRGPDECWPWTGARNETGYGSISQYLPPNWKRRLLAHRVGWILTHGPIPIELTIDHLCRNRLCQNTAHMELVTLSENGLRG